MQRTRQQHEPPAKITKEEKFVVPSTHWDALGEKDPSTICENALAEKHTSGGFLVRFLIDNVMADMDNRCIRRFDGESWEKIDHPLLELLVLVYLLNASPHSFSNEMISVKDLRDALFFQGPHALRTAKLVTRYGHDLAGFKAAAENLGGESLDLADAAYRFLPFPKVPLYYLLWEGDDEFEPNLSVLFDRSIEQHLSADAIWGLVTLVSGALRKGRDFYILGTAPA
ncbi:DUF3786 domain-containing protein [Thermodesulfobacteriota bacterium]